MLPFIPHNKTMKYRRSNAPVFFRAKTAGDVGNNIAKTAGICHNGTITIYERGYSK
jgi:hypothetical protein